MKIDLTQTFTNEQGTVIKSKDKDLSLAEVLTTALLTPVESDAKLSGQEKAELFNLWFDKIKDQKEAELSSEDIVMLKKRVGLTYAQIIVGQVYRILN